MKRRMALRKKLPESSILFLKTPPFLATSAFFKINLLRQRSGTNGQMGEIRNLHRSQVERTSRRVLVAQLYGSMVAPLINLSSL